MSRIIFFVLLYVLYRTVKSWYQSNFSAPNGGLDTSETPPEQVADLMVQDPYCHVYFPKREGVHLRENGQDYYFCSEKCKNDYLASLKKMHS